MRADLKCEEKDPSQSSKLTIHAIGVTGMPINLLDAFLLVGIEHKSHDLHEASRTR